VEQIFGSRFNDTFIGAVGSRQVFIGLQGNDTFLGTGGNGRDVVDYSFDWLFGGWHGVVVNQSANSSALGLPPDTARDSFGDFDTLPGVRDVIGTRFDDQISGGGNDNHHWGLDGNDQLFGRGDNDILEGGDGRDRLEGGSDFDTLIGGRGPDTFVFDAPTGTSTDEVVDFGIGRDRIAVYSSDYGLPAGPLAPDRFETGSAPTTGHAQFFYDTSADTLYWDANGMAGGSVAIATFGPAVTLSHTDFVVI
jgi:Ca2+-binding RTX toxin-like protein